MTDPPNADPASIGTPHHLACPVITADPILTEVPVPKPTLALKSTVTRRPPADPVDQAERLSQAEHHQATENATVTATEPATAEQTEHTIPKPKVDPHALQSAFLTSCLNRLVTVFTINGIKLVGKLRQFDQFTLLIEGPDRIRSLIFKHAVSTIASTNDRYDQTT